MLNIKESLKSTKLYEKFNNFRWRERLISKGKDNPDKTFYIIRRHSDQSGLFSFILTNIGSIKLALDSGYLPIIDMMSSPNPMLSANEVGKVNAWELFFLQPCSYTLNDIRKSKNIVLGSINPPAFFPDYPILNDDNEIIKWQEIAHKYIIFRPEILSARDQYITHHFDRNNKILGVLCRGTDYINRKPKNHPVQPDIEDVIKDVHELILTNQYGLIYLATEDESIWTRFNNEFPNMILSFQRNHFSISGNENINDSANKIFSPYERNKEYLISISILAKCNALIAGATSGSIGALLLSDNYEYYKIYQLGLYK